MSKGFNFSLPHLELLLELQNSWKIQIKSDRVFMIKFFYCPKRLANAKVKWQMVHSSVQSSLPSAATKRLKKLLSLFLSVADCLEFRVKFWQQNPNFLQVIKKQDNSCNCYRLQRLPVHATTAGHGGDDNK